MCRRLLPLLLAWVALVAGEVVLPCGRFTLKFDEQGGAVGAVGWEKSADGNSKATKTAEWNFGGMIRGNGEGPTRRGLAAGLRSTLLRLATVSIPRTTVPLWQISAGRQGASVFRPTAFARAAWRVS